jgi:predicted TIM-barrel fold metal-dependent hydrolase
MPTTSCSVVRALAELKVPLLFMSGRWLAPTSPHRSVRFDRVARRCSAMPVVLGHGCYPYVTKRSLAFQASHHYNVYVSPRHIFAPGGRA